MLAIEPRLHARDSSCNRPAWGDDVKVMALRNRGRLALAAWVRECAGEHGFTECSVVVNAADDVEARSLYLTVTGTSAGAGDDGQVGRGNCVNGLITPLRPMSAGKNPVGHVGKIYNVGVRNNAGLLRLRSRKSGIPEV